MRIGLDVMGGDYAPAAIVKGAIAAKEELSADDELVLFGRKSDIEKVFEQCGGANISDFTIVDCPEVIDMHDSPIKAFKVKPDSSLAVGFGYLKAGKIDTFASAGNSGAMLVGTMYSVGLAEGVLRPCLAALIPKEKEGVTVLLDVGVDTDTKPDTLYQFGLLGSLYAESTLNIKNPRVALLNIGEEEGKGNLQCKAAYQLMKDSSYNFVGNAEPREIFSDNVDVIVCDGFVGNLIMKNIEAFARSVAKRGLVDDFIKRFNYEIYGGLPLLGANKVVIIGHGVSNDKAIKSMILQSKKIYQSDIISRLSDSFKANK
ncbi:MAG: phosphate acyltransferase [Bacteroidales bacterium]|nr:phosphate acyltransferase [Bacteroidales bacterium]